MIGDLFTCSPTRAVMTKSRQRLKKATYVAHVEVHCRLRGDGSWILVLQRRRWNRQCRLPAHSCCDLIYP